MNLQETLDLIKGNVKKSMKVKLRLDLIKQHLKLDVYQGASTDRFGLAILNLDGSLTLVDDYMEREQVILSLVHSRPSSRKLFESNSVYNLFLENIPLFQRELLCKRIELYIDEHWLPSARNKNASHGLYTSEKTLIEGLTEVVNTVKDNSFTVSPLTIKALCKLVDANVFYHNPKGLLEPMGGERSIRKTPTTTGSRKKTGKSSKKSTNPPNWQISHKNKLKS